MELHPSPVADENEKAKKRSRRKKKNEWKKGVFSEHGRRERLPTEHFVSTVLGKEAAKKKDRGDDEGRPAAASSASGASEADEGGEEEGQERRKNFLAEALKTLAARRRGRLGCESNTCVGCNNKAATERATLRWPSFGSNPSSAAPCRLRSSSCSGQDGWR